MKLYHGSKSIIEKPIYGEGKLHNDYGRGFYCTEDENLALEWAVTADSDGYANEYNIDISDFKILSINSDEYCILHWITILLQNRIFDTTTPLAYEAKRYMIENYSLDTDSYDIIRGYRADDGYFTYAQEFLNGTISVQQLREAMLLGKLGEQIMLKSEDAFNALTFIGAREASSSIWYPKKEARDSKARATYYNGNRVKYVRGQLYITSILDEEIKANDLRLR